jgi:hypothetical protein
VTLKTELAEYAFDIESLVDLEAKPKLTVLNLSGNILL